MSNIERPTTHLCRLFIKREWDAKLENLPVMLTTLNDLRRFTVARNFFTPTTLKRALRRMAFVQADPIRAPARAQDLILRQRVMNYRAGDLERRYTSLDIEEDFFIIYGFVTRSLYALMHPRSDAGVPSDDVGRPWANEEKQRAQLLLDFVRERGTVHPREVDEYFSHGKVTNYWGGTSNATTHLLDAMHYRGILRVARREKGIRIYSVAHNGARVEIAAEKSGEPQSSMVERIDALVDVVVHICAPLTGPSLAYFVRRLRYAAPQLHSELASALQRAKHRLARARIDGVEWYWPSDEKISRVDPDDQVRLLAPFDPVVRDRDRFEMLWGWSYRFEAYTPAPKRKLGYYALPLLWRDEVIGWGNLSTRNNAFQAEFGYVNSQPRTRAFKRALDAEIERMREFLSLTSD